MTARTWQQLSDSFDKRVNECDDIIARIEKNLMPNCAGCGATENLTEAQAIPDSTYWLCPEHLAEERER